MTEEKSEHLRHLLHGLKQVAEDKHDALAIANSASMFLISRCEMIEINPFLAFIFLRHLCNRNIENFLDQSMTGVAKHHNIELDDDTREAMMGLAKAMEEALLHGLTEKEVAIGDEI